MDECRYGSNCHWDYLHAPRFQLGGTNPRCNGPMVCPDAIQVSPNSPPTVVSETRFPFSKRFTNTLGMHFVRIDPGTFIMGRPAAAPEPPGDESPNDIQHRVSITRAFYIQTTHVTQAQWKAMMGSNPSLLKGDEYPVTNIKWKDSVDFCRQLSRSDGKSYRLPTEAEWEYSCRAGTTGPYGGGKSLEEVGWFHENSGNNIHPVAQKLPNGWDLYDMHGNVWQWCSDYIGDYPATDVQDPTGPVGPGDTHFSRASRGGSWRERAMRCRAFSRQTVWGDVTSDVFGFRICLGIGNSPADPSPNYSSKPPNSPTFPATSPFDPDGAKPKSRWRN